MQENQPRLFRDEFRRVKHDEHGPWGLQMIAALKRDRRQCQPQMTGHPLWCRELCLSYLMSWIPSYFSVVE